MKVDEVILLQQTCQMTVVMMMATLAPTSLVPGWEQAGGASLSHPNLSSLEPTGAAKPAAFRCCGRRLEALDRIARSDRIAPPLSGCQPR